MLSVSILRIANGVESRPFKLVERRREWRDGGEMANCCWYRPASPQVGPDAVLLADVDAHVALQRQTNNPAQNFARSCLLDVKQNCEWTEDEDEVVMIGK